MSHRVGKYSLSILVIILALNLGSGSMELPSASAELAADSGGVSPVLPGGSAGSGQGSSPLVWALASPSEDGPLFSSVKSFPAQKLPWHRHPWRRSRESFASLLPPQRQRTGQRYHSSPQRHFPRPFVTLVKCSEMMWLPGWSSCEAMACDAY